MSRTRTTALLGLAVSAATLAAMSLVFADDERESRALTTPAAPGAERYRSECGSCHLAYPPGLLSPSEWTRVMSGLEQHFGDNAELGPEARSEITAYLTRHGGRDQPPQSALRITGKRWFRHEHDELPARMVQDNPQVRSFSNCAACHRDAAQGGFDEHRVLVPNYGRWD